MADHEHAWPAPLDCVALAEDVCATEYAQGYLVGFEAPGEDRRPVGAVPISPDGWTAEGSLAEGTLTLRPSVDYQSPPRPRRHGWITDGKWSEA